MVLIVQNFAFKVLVGGLKLSTVYGLTFLLTRKIGIIE